MANEHRGYYLMLCLYYLLPIAKNRMPTLTHGSPYLFNDTYSRAGLPKHTYGNTRGTAPHLASSVSSVLIKNGLKRMNIINASWDSSSEKFYWRTTLRGREKYFIIPRSHFAPDRIFNSLFNL